MKMTHYLSNTFSTSPTRVVTSLDVVRPHQVGRTMTVDGHVSTGARHVTMATSTRLVVAVRKSLAALDTRSASLLTRTSSRTTGG